jgi:hypothetical protein
MDHERWTIPSQSTIAGGQKWVVSTLSLQVVLEDSVHLTSPSALTRVPVPGVGKPALSDLPESSISRADLHSIIHTTYEGRYHTMMNVISW